MVVYGERNSWPSETLARELGHGKRKREEEKVASEIFFFSYYYWYEIMRVLYKPRP